MASPSHAHAQSPSHHHGHSHRKLSLRHSDPSTLTPTTSDNHHRHDHDAVCPHDHEHANLMSRHHHSASHGSDAGEDSNISLPSNSRLAEQAVAPFLAQHIPMQYNPVGHIFPPGTTSDDSAASSTKFCYRHRPDLKCRRQANEPSMEQLQNVSPPAFHSRHEQILMPSRRNWALCLSPINRLSPTSGLSSLPHPQSTATLCCRASSPNAASHNFHISPPPFVTSSRLTSCLPCPRSLALKSYATSTPLLYARPPKSVGGGGAWPTMM